MFKINDIVVYGLNGVCKIVDIKELKLASNPTTSGFYYSLNPIDSKADHLIYVPVDKVKNEVGVMRALYDRRTLEDFLDTISDISPLEIVSEKCRRDEYKAALLTMDPKCAVAIIKSVKNRKRRSTQRKNISDTDHQFEKLSLKFICHELSVVLGITYEEAEYRVLDVIDYNL